MGKAAIILIVGLGVIISIAATSIISRTSDVQKSSMSRLKDSNAKNIANSAAEYYILQLKGTPSLRGTFSIGSILGGSASVTLADWAYGVSDSIRLASIGKYEEAVETTVVLLTSPSTLPAVNAAFSFRCVAPTFSESGTLDIDGRNHDITGMLLAPSSNDRPGVAVMNAPDTAIFVPAHAAQINGTADAVFDPAIADPAVFVPALIAKADYVMVGSYSSPQTWGSAISPKIVYCSGSVKFSQVCDGWGILIVEKLESTNKFTWRGLVIATSNADWKTSNTMKIYGGLVFGTSGSSKYNSSGVANIYYSTAGLDLAHQAAGLGGGKLRVANWME